MSKLTGYAASAALILIVGACQREAFRPEAIDQDYLTLGKGGGMTNQVDTYYVLADGHVYRHDNFTKAYQPLGRLDRTTRIGFFEEALAIDTTFFGCQEPGNLYYFLTLHTQDTVRSCTWGKSGFDPPEAITAFYQATQQHINDL